MIMITLKLLLSDGIFGYNPVRPCSSLSARGVSHHLSRLGVAYVLLSVFAPAPVAYSQIVSRPGFPIDRTKLSARQAREYVLQAQKAKSGKFTPAVQLDQVVELKLDAAAELATHDGNISLNGLQELTDECAVLLGKGRRNLFLNGLIALSEQAAIAISQPGRSLLLNGLQDLPANVAAALGRCGDQVYGGALELNGLTSLSDEASTRLMSAPAPVYYLDLNGLTSLSETNARELSRCRGGLSLRGVTELSDSAAEAFAQSKIRDLNLAGLTSLSDSAAESLSRLESVLILDGLASVSPAAARSFAKHKKALSLDGVTFLSSEAASSLAAHEEYLTLEGIKQLPTKAATALRANAQIKLPEKWETISEKEAEGMASSSQPNMKPSKGAAAASSPSIKKLADVLVRVPRGGKVNPGRRIQAAQRLVKVDNIDADSSLGRMLDAYHSGVGEWRMADGKVEKMSAMGLASVNWAAEKAFPAWKSPHPDEESFVDVREEASGVRVTLEPTAVTDELLCSISFIVLSDVPANTRAEELDYLAGQVELFGGKDLQLESSPLIQPDTIVDFWSQIKRTRCTISHWKDNDPAGHIAAHTYGPLLFEVVNSEPEFMLLENVKIELSPQFRAGCRGLCDKVLELRKKQGQSNPPMCRDVPGQPVR